TAENTREYSYSRWSASAPLEYSAPRQAGSAHNGQPRIKRGATSDMHTDFRQTDRHQRSHRLRHPAGWPWPDNWPEPDWHGHAPAASRPGGREYTHLWRRAAAPLAHGP